MNPFLASLIRPHYHALKGYVSAGMEVKKDQDTVFMNANENPFSLPGLEGWNRYPEPQPEALLQAYARLYSVQPTQIVATRGADEAIQILIRLFCEPHNDAIVTHSPTFGMYPVDALAMPARVIDVPLIMENGNFKLNSDGLIAAGQDKATKLVFICNPNNPTATSFPHEQIHAICRALEGHAVILLDETYTEFSTHGSMTSDLAAHPNLIILRTLSKSYAMAGMRMGSMLCADENFINLVRTKCLDAYPLPRASIEAALKVMAPDNIARAHKNITTLNTERARLMRAFENSPHVIHVYPSDANFFLVQMHDPAGFLNFCKQNKIILRDFSSKPLTEGCLRISAGTPEQNDQLIGLLHAFAR